MVSDDIKAAVLSAFNLQGTYKPKNENYDIILGPFKLGPFFTSYMHLLSQKQGAPAGVADGSKTAPSLKLYRY